MFKRNEEANNAESMMDKDSKERFSKTSVSDAKAIQVIRCLKGEGFTRFHSRKYMQADSLNMNIGLVVYVTALYCLWNTAPWHVLAQVFALCLGCIWPRFLSRLGRGFYERWRDVLLWLHFVAHHIIGSRILHSQGIHSRAVLGRVDDPLKFLALFLVTSTILWHGIHAVTYKVSNAFSFVVIQPFLLFFLAGQEADNCRFVVTEHPVPSVGTFKSTCAIVDSVVSYLSWLGCGVPSLPGGTSLGWDGVEGYSECRHLMFFLLYYLGMVVPAFSLYVSEKAEWKLFLSSSASDLVWRGGPGEAEISEALGVLREEEARQRRRGLAVEGMLGWASLFACAVITWICVPYFFAG